MADERAINVRVGASEGRRFSCLASAAVERAAREEEAGHRAAGAAVAAVEAAEGGKELSAGHWRHEHERDDEHDEREANERVVSRHLF